MVLENRSHMMPQNGQIYLNSIFSLLRIPNASDERNGFVQWSWRELFPFNAESTEQCCFNHSATFNTWPTTSLDSAVVRLPSAFPLQRPSWASPQVTVPALRISPPISPHVHPNAVRTTANEQRQTLASLVSQFIKPAIEQSINTKSQNQFIHWVELNARPFVTSLVVRGFRWRADWRCKISVCADSPTDINGHNHHHDNAWFHSKRTVAVERNSAENQVWAQGSVIKEASAARENDAGWRRYKAYNYATAQNRLATLLSDIGRGRMEKTCLAQK